MNQKVTYMAFKNKKGQVIVVGTEVEAMGENGTIKVRLTKPADFTKEIIEKSTFEKHRNKLISPAQ